MGSTRRTVSRRWASWRQSLSQGYAATMRRAEPKPTQGLRLPTADLKLLTLSNTVRSETRFSRR